MTKAQAGPGLAEILQKIQERTDGWSALTPEEQVSARDTIYYLRGQARKAAKAAGLPEPELPAIPRLDAVEDEPEAAEDLAEEALEEGQEEELTFEIASARVAELRRQVWLLMADIETLPPGPSRREMAVDFDTLAMAASCASGSLNARPA